MKGMMGLLERAGLVARVDEAGASVLAQEPGANADLSVSGSTDATVSAPSEPGLSLEDVYAAASVPPSPYPAERLLRLLDGLRAMDEALRRQTIQAIDAADDTWTIQDPISDATHKVRALGAHMDALRAGVSEVEAETATRLAAVRQQQDNAVGSIKQQIAELESLMTREVTRGAQECAALESARDAKRQAASREIDLLTQTANELKLLATQFGAANGQ